jgi:hypothetical protein
MSKRERAVQQAAERRKLGRGEVLQLIFRTYAVSAPYILLFVAGMLVATWVVTELVFR